MNKRISLSVLFTISVLMTLYAAEITSGKPVHRTKEWAFPVPFRVLSSQPDASLDQNHAQFELSFEYHLLFSEETFPTIELSCNGVIERFQLDSTLTHTLTVSPEKNKFMMIRPGNYEEIIPVSIPIFPGPILKPQLPFPPQPVFSKCA